MSNRPTDILYQLIHSLEKSEKRNFKLYIKRSSGNEDLKIIKLFDTIDKMEPYDEAVLLRKLKDVTKPQLSNLKSHLYKELLASLRLLKSGDSLDLQLNELFDSAHILYKKGLFYQSLRIIDRAKEMAKLNQKYFFLPLLLSLEKRIEALNVTDTFPARIDELSEEANEANTKLDMVTRLSNLSLQMYGFFIANGHARNEDEEEKVKKFFRQTLPSGSAQQEGFYERLYFYQAYTWYAFIRQDFLLYYRYAQKWVDLFDHKPNMIRVETGHYIRGFHNLLNAHFDLRNYEKLSKDLKRFDEFSLSPRVQNNENFTVQSFVYIAGAKINFYIITGLTKEGLNEVPYIEEKLGEYSIFLDRHRVMVINYKIAMLYFLSGDYSSSIDYLQKIINDSSGLRTDLQCYARLVHLLAHYELGNLELMDYLTRSVFRYMSRMKNLTVIEQEMFRFFRNSFKFTRKQLKPEFEKFLDKVKHLEGNRFETRSFAYLDIISWLESKVEGKPMQEIIHTKYLASKRKRIEDE
ncbi:MAG: hypothetical protein BGN92_14505 [Sphingobacteriales bacterium 41-5]|nr:MAG: hypothetical protein BGN92_14505 [Sphingobacteriales bacterium 41-5]